MSLVSKTAIKWTWSWPGVIGLLLIALLLIALLPIYAQFLPQLDGLVEPVTTRITIIDPQPDPIITGKLDFRFSYTKIRTCEYISTDAQINGGHVDFISTEAPTTTRLPGKQISQLWRLSSPTLDGLSIYFIHRCNPLFLTITQVYP